MIDRNGLIKMAETAVKAKVAPMEIYLTDTVDGTFVVSLSNRPPKVFAGDKPLDMDVVFKVDKTWKP